MPFEPVLTADGSLSCLDSETGQLCHNRAGAYSEAVTTYVLPSGLLAHAHQQGHIRVLDACYGLGYNTWALINELVKPDAVPATGQTPHDSNVVVSVVGIEQSEEVLRMMPRILDHPTFDVLKSKIDPEEHNTYYRTLECFLNTKGARSEPLFITINIADWLRFELTLYVDDLRRRVPALETARDSGATSFDAVFHDPFSPQKMPELWTVDLFRRYFELLSARQGRLLTYSAAAAVRGGLIEAGFSIAKTRGLGDKDGGTVALTTENLGVFPDGSLPLYDSENDWELEYLRSRAGIPYRDDGLRQTRPDILSRRADEQANSPRPSGGSALKRKPRYLKAE